MKFYILITSLLLSLNTLSDNNPIYDDKNDLKFALLDIPSAHVTQCKINISEEIRDNKNISHAVFQCDYSNFENQRKISMIGMNSKDLINFIKQQFSEFKVLNNFKQYPIKGGFLLVGDFNKPLM